MPMACTASALRSAGLALPLGRDPDLVRGLERHPRRQLVAERECKQRDRARERQPAEPGMESQITATKAGIHGASKNDSTPWLLRKPRSCARSRSAWAPIACPGERVGETGREHGTESVRSSQAAIRTSARLRVHVEQPEDEQREAREQRQRSQGIEVAGSPGHPVVDLKHIERRDQHQQVDEQAEAADRGQAASGLAKGGLDAVRCLSSRSGPA